MWIVAAAPVTIMSLALGLDMLDHHLPPGRGPRTGPGREVAVT